MYTVIYQVLKVWTQHHFVLLPRHWFSSTKSGQPLIKLYICWTHWLSAGIIMMMRRRIKIIRDLVWFPVWGTSNSEGKKELKQARLINKKACLQGSKKTWIQACPLRKQLSHFACQGSLLTHLSGWPLPIGQESFESYLPSKKIYSFQATQRDFFWALLHNCTLSPSLDSKLLVTVVMMLQNLYSHGTISLYRFFGRLQSISPWLHE